MNIHTLTAGLFLLSGLGMSCKKLIQVPPSLPDQLAQQEVFSDSTDVLSAVAGIYLYSRNVQAGFSYQDGDLSVSTGTSADELALTTNTYDTGTPQFYTNTLTSINGIANNLWTAPYQGMYQINACLEGIQSSTGISAAFKQQLLGEMEVTRALYYFNLVNLFGAVPLVTTTDYKVTATLARAPVDSVYAQIVADLTDARQKLTAAYPSPGHIRPNLYVASALLAKVYLYLGQWQEAHDMAGQVIGSGVYSLVPDANNVFLDGSTEAIWQLPANGTYYATTEAGNYVPTPGYTPTYPVNNTLLGAFETGDQRLQKWVGTSVVPTGTTNTTYYFPYKYKNSIAASPTIEDFMVLRLADQYLVRAEASAELGDAADAQSDLNIVRARAGLAPSTAAGTALMTAIMHERQVEMCFEWGNRWYDLKRWGTVNAVLSAEKPGWQTTTSLYPVPQSEIKNDPFMTQNLGYQ